MGKFKAGLKVYKGVGEFLRGKIDWLPEYLKSMKELGAPGID